jgi:predicted amidophosphoribosyltransferase
MPIEHPRMVRELRTIEAMIALYCADKHKSHNGLCDECRALFDYAQARLERCPFQENKTTCARCPVHCYKPAMRQQIRVVMRYAGPRMLYHHPVLAVRHLFDDRRKTPTRPPQPPRTAKKN